MSDIMKSLAEPFPSFDIEWYIAVTTQDKTKGMAMPFITARAAQDRLDEVVGPMNWMDDFVTWKDGAQLCKISIWDEVKKIWVSKVDGSGDTDIESVKGGLSQSFKRCASLWGIGRYLYYLESPWVEIEPQGRSYCIKPNQQIILPEWALPGGTGKPGVNDQRRPTVEIIGYAPQQPQRAPQQPAGNNTGNTQQQSGGNLSEKQIQRAYAKGLNAGQEKEDILLWIKKKYGIDNIADLTRKQYDELCAALDKAAMQR